MAAGDVVQTPQIQGELTRDRVNQELRKIWQRLNAGEGRTDSAQIRDSLEVLGGLSAAGITATSADLGAGALSAQSAGIDPDIPSDIRPQITSRDDTLGFPVPLETGASVFHFSAYDAFMGKGTGSGNIGALGWGTVGSGFITLSVTDYGHPGVVTVNTDTFTTPHYLYLNDVDIRDIKYLGAVVKVEDNDRSGMRFGLIASPGTIGEGSAGIYFSFLSTTSPNWRTVTNDGGGFTSTVSTSSIVVVQDAWYLLEMVLDGNDSVDFYINRQRLFRHTSNIPAAGTTETPAFVVESTDGAGSTGSIDTFLAMGQVPNAQLWT